MSQLAGGAISGLEYVGGALDKIGPRTVRSAIGGAPLPDALAHLVPFSDEMGLTDRTKVPSGRELLEQGGLVNPDTAGLDMGDVLGFGAEVALDPTNWVTFGGAALGKAGLAAAKAGKLLPKAMGTARTAAEIGAVAKQTGKLAPTIASRIHAGQGGLLGLALPFSQEPFALIGTGPTAARFAENVVQPVGDFVKYALPSRHLRSLLDPTAGPVASKEFQVAHEFAARPEVEAAMAQYRGDQVKLLREVAGAKISPAAKPEFDRISMMAGESKWRNVGQGTHQAPFGTKPNAMHTPDYGAWQREMSAQGMDPKMLTPEQFKTAVSVGERVSDIQNGMLKMANELGVPKKALEDDFAGYMTRVKARYPDMDVGEAWKGFERAFEHGTASDIKRKFRDIPGGTDTLNQIARSKDFAGPSSPMSPKRAAKEIREKYLNWSGVNDDLKKANLMLDVARLEFENAMKKGIPDLSPFQANIDKAQSLVKDATKAVNRVRKQGTTLAKWAKGIPDIYAGEGRNYFSTDVLESLGVSMQRMAKVRSGAEAIHEVARRFSTNTPGPDTVPISSFFEGAGLTYNKGGKAKGALATLAKRMGVSIDDVQNIHIPKELAEDAKRYITLWTRPEEVKGLAKLYDNALALFKTSVTQVFPAFHVRNFQDGVFRNWISGAASVDSMADTSSLLRGGKIRITPQMAANGINSAEDVINAAFAHGVAWAPNSPNQIADITGQAVHGGSPNIPGLNGTAKSAGQVAADWWNNSAKDPRRAGAGAWLDWLDSSKDTNRVFAKGAAIGNEVEDFVRMSHFLEKLRQGYTPEVAAASTKATHFVYKDITKFERSWMKRAVPFYVFARKNLPYAVKQLIEKPSRMSSSIRALNSGRDENRFTPPWVGGEGAAIPLYGAIGQSLFGDPPSGHSRYLTGLGLGAVEEPFQRFHFGNDALKRTAYDHLSMLTPIAKAPLELLAGQQFLTGRELQDLKPSASLSAYGLLDQPVTGNSTIGRAASQAIANSPYARFDTTMRKLTYRIADDRKSDLMRAVNVLTGANIVDVDDRKAKASIVREELKRRLDSSDAIRSYEGYFVPQNADAPPSAEESLLLQYWQQLRRDGRSRQR